MMSGLRPSVFGVSAAGCSGERGKTAARFLPPHARNDGPLIQLLPFRGLFPRESLRVAGPD